MLYLKNCWQNLLKGLIKAARQLPQSQLMMSKLKSYDIF